MYNQVDRWTIVNGRPVIPTPYTQTWLNQVIIYCGLEKAYKWPIIKLMDHLTVGIQVVNILGGN